MLAWHPLGGLIASAANDGVLKFWTREPPGSKLSADQGEWADQLLIDYGPIKPTGTASTSGSSAGGVSRSIVLGGDGTDQRPLPMMTLTSALLAKSGGMGSYPPSEKGTAGNRLVTDSLTIGVSHNSRFSTNNNQRRTAYSMKMNGNKDNVEHYTNRI